MWIPKLEFSYKTLRKVLNYSNYVLGFQSINYWSRNADNLIIGKVLGADQLGFYSVAYKLMMIPYQGITGIINPTLHPILAKVQDDSKRIKLAYEQLLNTIGMLSVLISCYMFFFSKNIVLQLYGNAFENSISVFMYLSIISAIQPITATTGPILLASNKANIYFFTGIFSSLIFVIGFIITVNQGITVLSIGYLVSNIIVSLVVFYFTYKKVLKGSYFTVIKLYLKMMMIFGFIYTILYLTFPLYSHNSDIVVLLIGILIISAVSLPLVVPIIKKVIKRND